MASKPKLHLLKLQNTPILKQLQIEEALLRTDHRNWFILNSGSPPAIVMGISGQAEKLINLSLLQKNPLPVIRRFSGGGTVIVDEETCFGTFICNADFAKIPCYPEKILHWSSEFYKDVMKHPEFALLENDYVFGKKKCGGNAQYIKKERWLHHTSFLWDYSETRMEYLKLPEKRPKYRVDRTHADFLCRLKDWFSEKTDFFERTISQLKKTYDVQLPAEEEILKILNKEHRKTTLVL